MPFARLSLGAAAIRAAVLKRGLVPFARQSSGAAAIRAAVLERGGVPFARLSSGVAAIRAAILKRTTRGGELQPPVLNSSKLQEGTTMNGSPNPPRRNTGEQVKTSE